MNEDKTKEEDLALASKKPYTAPKFRYESVFEVSALSCGKIEPTQSSCSTSRKSS